MHDTDCAIRSSYNFLPFEACKPQCTFPARNRDYTRRVEHKHVMVRQTERVPNDVANLKLTVPDALPGFLPSAVSRQLTAAIAAHADAVTINGPVAPPAGLCGARRSCGPCSERIRGKEGHTWASL